jgi:hypothetical protein
MYTMATITHNSALNLFLQSSGLLHVVVFWLCVNTSEAVHSSETLAQRQNITCHNNLDHHQYSHRKDLKS